MDWKLCLTIFCGLLFIISPILAQRPGRNQRRRNPTRQPGRRGNRGRSPSGPRNRNRPQVVPVSDSTECELIQVPMCKGMVGYEYTRLPNIFGHTTQAQVYEKLQLLWTFMDNGCSKDFRRNACGFYLPKCIPGQRELHPPCRQTCASARKCRKKMQTLQVAWPPQFACRLLPPKTATSKCIEPATEQACSQTFITCSTNNMTMCANLPFSRGSLPNMFLQCSEDMIEQEIQQYQALIDSNCSPNLRFLICGISMPYCVRAEVPFALPCQEICEEVRQACEPIYTQLTNGLPWPNKFQCHRYPLSTNPLRTCASPSDVSIRVPETAETTSRPRTNNRRPANRRTGRRQQRRRPNRRRPTTPRPN